MDSRTAGIHVGPWRPSLVPRGAPRPLSSPKFAQEAWGLPTLDPLPGPGKVALCLLCALTYSRALRLLSGDVLR